MRANEAAWTGTHSLPIYVITILFAFASSVASETLNGNPREVHGGQREETLMFPDMSTAPIHMTSVFRTGHIPRKATATSRQFRRCSPVPTPSS